MCLIIHQNYYNNNNKKAFLLVKDSLFVRIVTAAAKR